MGTDPDLRGFFDGFQDNTYGYLLPYYSSNAKVARFCLGTTMTTTQETYTLTWVAYEDGESNHTEKIQYKGPRGSEFYVGDFRTDGCIGSADAPDGPVKQKTEYCSNWHGLSTLVVRRSNSTDIVGAMNCCNNQARLINVSGSGTIRNFTSNGGH
eukprot:TRINITY_DN6836_c2_g1_i4.p1 TRINITY_DN6836_c2_g1~~TRINITY_DN6836_c2_g1_i4.p1  ORF type:complete len:155 (+),score=20.14 TRINITY_DN6836_c2_g1_i4:314-778(+)